MNYCYVDLNIIITIGVKMKEFNKYFSNLIFEIGKEKIEGSDKKSGMAMLQIALFFGCTEARNIINEKNNRALVSDLESLYHKNDMNFQLFIISRLGIGTEVDIKKSNAYLKTATENGEIGALLYKSLVEDVRSNKEGVLKYLGGHENSSLLQVRKDEFLGEERDYSNLYPECIGELIVELKS
jgi:hypothetical protein